MNRTDDTLAKQIVRGSSKEKMEREVTDEEITKLVKLKHLSPDHFKCRFIELFGKKVSSSNRAIYLRLVSLMERVDFLLQLHGE